jgi:hypothetical protein
VSDEIKELMKRGHDGLVTFLATELELGFTFVQLARTEMGLDPNASERARQNATAALAAVKHLESRIDVEERRAIQARALELEVAIRDLT